MTLHLRYTLTKEEMVEFGLFTAWNDPEKRDVRLKFHYHLVLYAFLLLVSGMSVFGSLRNNLESVKRLVIGLILVIITATALGGVLAKNNFRKQAERLLVNRRNENLFLPIEMIINTRGIENRDEVSRCAFSWEAISRTTETKKAFYLFLNSSVALVIPKRVMRNDELETLTKLLNQNITFRADVPDLLNA